MTVYRDEGLTEPTYNCVKSHTGDLVLYARDEENTVRAGADGGQRDTFTLEDNIYLPLVLAGKNHKEMRERLDKIAPALGIESLLNKYPYEVSGGQKQRASVARALITDPRIILADEPTGALDSKSSDELLELFTSVNKMGQTILMVTHSAKAASHASRVMFIKDGVIFHQIYKGSSTDVQMYQKISDALTLLARGGDLE